MRRWGVQRVRSDKKGFATQKKKKEKKPEAKN